MIRSGIDAIEMIPSDWHDTGVVLGWVKNNWFCRKGKGKVLIEELTINCDLNHFAGDECSDNDKNSVQLDVNCKSPKDKGQWCFFFLRLCVSFLCLCIFCVFLVYFLCILETCPWTAVCSWWCGGETPDTGEADAHPPIPRDTPPTNQLQIKIQKTNTARGQI